MSKSEKMLGALRAGEFDQAEKWLKQALNQDTPGELAELSEELRRLGFLEEEKRVVQRLLEKFPEEEELYLQLAEIAVEEDALDEAFSYLDQISEKNPIYVSALLLQASVYQLMELPEVSEEKLKQALEISPDEPIVAFALAEIYYEQGKFETAALAYAQLSEDWLREELGVCLAERIGLSYSMAGHFERAIEFLEQALGKEGVGREEVLARLGALYLQIDELARAIQLYEELHALQPLNVEYVAFFAKALALNHQLERAQEVLDDGIAANPYRVEYYVSASKIAYRRNEAKLAEVFLLRALELREEQDLVLFHLLTLYVESERFEEAMEIYEKMEEDSPLALWWVAKAAVGLEEFETADIFFKQALEDLQEEVEFLKEYVLFLRNEGQREEAKKWASQALKLQPEDEELAILLEEWNE